MACCGDVPTLETLAAVAILRERLPDLKVRVVNVVDLMRLQPDTEHPHGLSDARVRLALHALDKPIVFAYHGYPWLIHRLTYRRTNHDNLHVRGYKEEGTTTTPFDMVMLNDLDRFHLVIDVIDRVPGLATAHAHLRQHMVDTGSPPAPTRASTATTIRKCATGPGPSDATSWSSTQARRASSLSVVDAADGRRRSLRSTTLPPRHGGRAQDRPRRRAIRRADRRRRRGARASSRRSSSSHRCTTPPASTRSRSPALLPDIPHVAVFDTAFHRTMPEVATTYALPGGGARLGHAPLRLPRTVGCSGRPSWSGSRGSSSAISAAAPPSPPCATGAPSTRRWGSRRSKAFRWRRDRARSIRARCSTCSARQFDRRAGIGARARLRLARSRRLPARWRALEHSADPAAQFALDVFAYRVAQAVAAIAVALGGLDAIVFTGGVGEHAAPVRAGNRRPPPLARRLHVARPVRADVGARLSSSA